MTLDPAFHHEEVDLLLASAAGDPTAVRRLLDEVAPVVYGFVFARVGGSQTAAEDLLQETLFEAVRSASGFRGDSSLATWLCAIAKRRLARHYEAERKAEVARHGLQLVTEEDAEDRDVERLDRQDEVARALGRLSPLHRQVLVLKYLDDMSVEAISSQLGRSRIQVQSLLQRARQGLRSELEGEDG
ncbi:MAG TPA: sigma-70 family RNA polymerase sigma factor [Acidimicrobiales bacterium]|nr:sigma-70 family RNA polymerase sigma factor [Acidimicrobiales bacterium]